MKRKIYILVSALSIIPVSACSLLDAFDTNNTVLSSEQSLAALSYLSSGFLSLEASTISNVTIRESFGTSMTFLSTGQITSLDDSSVTNAEQNIDDISIYFNRLKTFIDQGTDSLGSITTMASDRPEYAFMITFTVNEEQYTIYYSIDETTKDLVGVIVIDSVEYLFTAHNQLNDKTDLERLDDHDGDGIEEEDEEDEEDKEVENDVEEQDENEDELEQKMEFVATNGTDTITVSYKVETEGDESSTKFEMVKNIGGVLSNVELHIEQEKNEYKVEVIEGNNILNFKKEVEGNGIEYKLEYSIDAVEGEVEIIETLDSLGNPIYQYKITEGERYIETEHLKPEIDED